MPASVYSDLLSHRIHRVYLVVLERTENPIANISAAAAERLC
jgi:hypothetical protein